MRVVYVNSGLNSAYEPFDRYIDLTFRDMDVDYRLFDYAAHIKFFGDAFDHVKREHDIGYAPEHLYKYSAAPLLQLVSEFEPDLVFTAQGYFLPPAIIESIQKTGALTALWVVDAHGVDTTLSYAHTYDYVFTSEPGLIEVFKERGCGNVFHLPPAVYPGVFRAQPAAHFESDICFIGEGLEGCVKVFDAIADFLTNSDMRVRILGRQWDALESLHKLKRFISHKNVYATDAAKYYANSKINLTLQGISEIVMHDNGEERHMGLVSPGNRMFEIAASGGFQLVDGSRLEHAEYFEAGRDIDVFASPAELVEKIEYYLKNEDKRQEMAGRAQERCIREHTYRNRLESLLEITLKNDDQSIIRDVIAMSNGAKSNLFEKDRFHSQKVDRLIAGAVPSVAQRVLDTNCGDGLLGEALKSKGIKEIYGVESDKTAADKAKHRLHKVIVGDLEEVELPFKSGYFDCIIYRGVLEHMTEPSRMLSKQRKLLAASGKILVCIPNTLYFPVVNDLLKGCWRYNGLGTPDGAHIKSFTLREITYLLRLAGYEVEGVEGVTNGRINDEKAHAFIRSMRPLRIAAESLKAEVQYSHYILTAKKAKSDNKQGVGLCLVKS